MTKNWFNATDCYGRTVIVFFVIENIARTNGGIYHVTKLFVNGSALKSN